MDSKELTDWTGMLAVAMVALMMLQMFVGGVVTAGSIYGGMTVPQGALFAILYPSRSSNHPLKAFNEFFALRNKATYQLHSTSGPLSGFVISPIKAFFLPAGHCATRY